jgi:hypothetical protein
LEKSRLPSCQYTSRSPFPEANLAKWAQTARIARGTVVRLAESHYSRGLRRAPRAQKCDPITKATRHLRSHPLATEQLKRAKLYLREQVSLPWLFRLMKGLDELSIKSQRSGLCSQVLRVVSIWLSLGLLRLHVFSWGFSA